MEVVSNQWKDAENEVEEVGLKRKQSLQRSSTSSSDTDVEGGGLELDQSTMKQEFAFRIGTEINAERILQRDDIEESIILPASDSPLPEDPTSLNIVTTKTARFVVIENDEHQKIIKENDQEIRQELYLERVFEKPPTHGFYCPNCKACIEKVYIQKGAWEQITSAPVQTLKPTDTIRCSSCFSFLIPIGSWLFPGLVSDDNGALDNEVTGSSNNNSVPQQTLKGTSQHKAPEPAAQSVAKDTSKPAVNAVNDSGKQTLHIIEDVLLLGTGPQKVASEVEDKISGTSIVSIPGNNVKSQDSSNHHGVTVQDPKNPVAPKKKHFWSGWAVISGASEASLLKQPETDSTKNSDWRVIMPAGSQDPITKQSEIDFSDNKQPEINVEVKVDGVSVYTGPAEQAADPDERTSLLTSRGPEVAQEAASSKTWEILKSIVYGGLTESLASLSVVTSAASADATALNIVALATANLIGGLFALVHNLRELKAEQPKRVENQTDAPVDRYNELLGQRQNFFLHAFFAIISFIVFGLVPPVVYGFSFRESDDKDFKLAAVAGASLLCITLLSIAKAYIQRPNSYAVYFQTVLYYVSTGAVASVLSYLAGDLVKKLLEKLAWFESASNFALQVPGMSVQKPGWKPY